MPKANVDITDLEGEVWRKIDWLDVAPREVFVSNLGRVKTVSGLILQKRGRQQVYIKSNTHINATKLNTDGYQMVRLELKGGRKTFTVHRLVARVFIPEIEGKPIINHLDGVRHNNRVDNLEWCTISENCKHRFKLDPNSVKGEKAPSGKLTNAQVLQIRALYAEKLESQYQLAARFGIKQSTVSCIVTRKNWSHI